MSHAQIPIRPWPPARMIVAVMVGLLALIPAPGASASEKDAAIQDTILRQIEAFANDDREQAWFFASEGVKQRFGSADVFVSMVREVYPAVHRATAIEFARRVPHGPFEVQVVRLRGPDGRLWDAYYRMVKSEDGWKVAGVRLHPAELGI